MLTETETPKKALHELEDCIVKAMKKVNVSKEGKLCPYLPEGSGYIHHFSFKKLKKQNPQELIKALKQHILDNDKPRIMPAKPRNRRNSKNGLVVRFTRVQMGRLQIILKKEKDSELLDLVTPLQSARDLQKRMREMIKEKKVDPALWEAYAALMKKEA